MEGRVNPIRTVSRAGSQMTGMENAEAEGVVFDDSEYLSGPFGTRENPVVVRTGYDYRIVGCTGTFFFFFVKMIKVETKN